MLTVRARAIAALPVAGALAAIMALVPAAPASADEELQLSLNGTTWLTTLNSPVFPAGVSLVPGSTLDGTFFVRNASTSPAWVRVGVAELVVTSQELALSMNMTTIGTTSDNASGSTSRLSAGDIVCNDFLARSTPLPPGGIVRVDASLSFRADVAGTTAQNEAARVAFIAELSEVDLNALNQPLCTGTVQIGPVDETPDPAPPDVPATGTGGGPGTSGGGTGGSGGTGGAGASGGGTGGTSAFGPPATGSISGGTFEVDDGSRPYAGVGTDMRINTVQWWDEYAILVLIGAALAGAIARFTAQRRWGDSDRRTGGP